MNLQKWLSRLAFSFVILAVLFLWQARQSGRDATAEGQRWVSIYMVAAVACAILAIAGLRARHRRSSNDRLFETKKNEDD